ncbi:MAG: hypothetical protein AB7O31_08795 [Burkholderiales bacterium]
MIIVRAAVLLAAVGLAVLVILFLVSGERRYLRYAWRLFQVILGVVLFVLLLLFGERLLGEL